MKILKIAKKSKNSLKVTKCSGGGWIIAMSKEEDGHTYFDAIDVPEEFELKGDYKELLK